MSKNKPILTQRTSTSLNHSSAAGATPAPPPTLCSEAITRLQGIGDNIHGALNRLEGVADRVQGACPTTDVCGKEMGYPDGAAGQLAQLIDRLDIQSTMLHQAADRLERIA